MARADGRRKRGRRHLDARRHGRLQHARARAVRVAHSQSTDARCGRRSDVWRVLRAGVPAGSMGEPHRQHAVVRSRAARGERRPLRHRPALARSDATSGSCGVSLMKSTLSQPVRTLIAGVICLTILSGMLVLHAWPLWTGQPALLPVTPIDPRDLFRGEYVALDTPATRLAL